MASPDIFLQLTFATPESLGHVVHQPTVAVNEVGHVLSSV